MLNIDTLKFIDEKHLSETKDSKSPTQYTVEADFSILTIRLLRLTPMGLEYFTSCYIQNQNNFFYKDQDSVERCNGLKEFHQKIRRDLDFLSHMIKQYSESVESIEDKIFSQMNLRSLNSEIFNLKKDILKLRRVAERLHIVLIGYFKETSSLYDEIDCYYKDTVSDCEVEVRLTISLLDKLDTCFNYLNSIKNDGLNKNIYMLSIISGIFLPLNLIVGFFGMNTNGLFLANNTNATMIVFYIIVSIFTFLLIGIPTLNLINKIFVSKVFGRYSVYAKLSKKLEKVNDDFKII